MGEAGSEIGGDRYCALVSSFDVLLPTVDSGFQCHKHVFDHLCDGSASESMNRWKLDSVSLIFESLWTKIFSFCNVYHKLD